MEKMNVKEVVKELEGLGFDSYNGKPNNQTSIFDDLLNQFGEKVELTAEEQHDEIMAPIVCVQEDLERYVSNNGKLPRILVYKHHEENCDSMTYETYRLINFETGMVYEQVVVTDNEDDTYFEMNSSSKGYRVENIEVFLLLAQMISEKFDRIFIGTSDIIQAEMKEMQDCAPVYKGYHPRHEYSCSEVIHGIHKEYLQNTYVYGEYDFHINTLYVRNDQSLTSIHKALAAC